MKKYVAIALGLTLTGAAASYVGWRKMGSPLIKEAPVQTAATAEVLKLANQREALLEKIQQLKPGGSLSGRLVDLEARKDQLVANYPDGHPDIDLLTPQIETTREALKQLPKIELEYSTINEKLTAARARAVPAPPRIDSSRKLNSFVQWPHLVFASQVAIKFTGETPNFAGETAKIQGLESLQKAQIVFKQNASEPPSLTLEAEEGTPARVVAKLIAASGEIDTFSQKQQRDALNKKLVSFREQKAVISRRYEKLAGERKALLAGPTRNSPNAQLVAKIEVLKERRRSLIENYPTHSEIPLLAIQIKNLLAQTTNRSASVVGKMAVYDRQMNETKVWMDYLTRRVLTLEQEEKAVASQWVRSGEIAKPVWPVRVVGWPIAAGIAGLGFFGLVMVVLRWKKKRQNHATPHASENLLSALNASKKSEPAEPVAPVAVPETPAIALEVVSPGLPSDPLTEKAASFYTRWMEVAKVLYAPSTHPPEGILDSVTPLLEESCEFLPEGHDVLARYLARSVEPGNLPAHVARTVLMALTGAQEAGMSSDHRLAMALAALFHDLAVVPRPAAQQDDVGSEVGRLSAVLLRKIPGLAPSTLTMVEDILIGMDEFKLETWQNVSQGTGLEPLSKVLREIDRFEKVLQKQKSRMTRQLKAAND